MVYTTEKWCQTTSVSLEGRIPGTYSELDTRRAAITSAFSSDFKTLKVIENGSDILEFDHCIIRSVNFSPSNFGAADYSIEIECYESSNFNGTFGVLEPTNEWSFNQEENNFVTISHKVSARGVKTSNQPIVNAKNFVNSLAGSGTFSDITPVFSSGIYEPNLILLNSGVNIDRLAGSYSVDESYVIQTGIASDAFNCGCTFTDGITSVFNADVSSGISDDFISVGVNCTIQGSKADSSATLRSKLPPVDALHFIAVNAIKESGVVAAVSLNSGALNYSIDEDLNSRTVSVKASFNNDFAYAAFSQIHGTTIPQSSFSGAYYDYEISADTDSITSISSIGVNGNIKAQVDGVQNKIDRVSGMYYNYICNQPQGVTGYLHSIAERAYSDLGFAVHPLNPGPESISITDNYVKGEISLSATFSDKDFKPGFKTSSFNISVKPALAQYRAKSSANRDGLYQVFTLGTRTREEITIGGNLSAYAENSDYRIDARNYMDSLRAFYIPANGTYVTSESLDETPPPYCSIGFSHSYNYGTVVNAEFIPASTYDKMYVRS
tara:strand:+ start:580 stop:2235 length:1656 start_codon:yes stop_codon:yes gene_type:complete